MGIRFAGCVVWGLFLSWFFYRDFRSYLCLWPVTVLLVAAEGEGLRRKKKLEMETMFQDFLVSLSASLRAGYSLPNGFRASLEELMQLHGERSFLVKELRCILRAMKEGKGCEEMLIEIGKELDLDSMYELGSTLKVATLVGGNLTKIFAQTMTTLQHKHHLKQEIEDGMAGRRYEARIMELVPFALVVYVELGTPGFFEMLFLEVYGRLVMSLCLVVYLIAKLWMHCIIYEAMEV